MKTSPGPKERLLEDVKTTSSCGCVSFLPKILSNRLWTFLPKPLKNSFINFSLLLLGNYIIKKFFWNVNLIGQKLDILKIFRYNIPVRIKKTGGIEELTKLDYSLESPEERN
jgi:hypothetical protein